MISTLQKFGCKESKACFKLRQPSENVSSNGTRFFSNRLIPDSVVGQLRARFEGPNSIFTSPGEVQDGVIGMPWYVLAVTIEK